MRSLHKDSQSGAACTSWRRWESKGRRCGRDSRKPVYILGSKTLSTSSWLEEERINFFTQRVPSRTGNLKMCGRYMEIGFHRKTNNAIQTRDNPTIISSPTPSITRTNATILFVFYSIRKNRVSINTRPNTIPKSILGNLLRFQN